MPEARNKATRWTRGKIAAAAACSLLAIFLFLAFRNAREFEGAPFLDSIAKTTPLPAELKQVHAVQIISDKKITYWSYQFSHDFNDHLFSFQMEPAGSKPVELFPDMRNKVTYTHRSLFMPSPDGTCLASIDPYNREVALYNAGMKRPETLYLQDYPEYSAMWVNNTTLIASCMQQGSVPFYFNACLVDIDPHKLVTRVREPSQAHIIWRYATREFAFGTRWIGRVDDYTSSDSMELYRLDLIHPEHSISSQELFPPISNGLAQWRAIPSPDGKRFAFEMHPSRYEFVFQNKWPFYKRQFRSITALCVTNSDGSNSRLIGVLRPNIHSFKLDGLSWSSDGRELRYINGTTLYTVPAP